MNKIKHIKEVVGQIKSSLRNNPAKTLEHIQESWQKHADPKLSSHTRILSYKNSILKMSVDSAPLKHELDCYLKEKILKNLCQTTELQIQDIRFILDSIKK